MSVTTYDYRFLRGGIEIAQAGAVDLLAWEEAPDPVTTWRIFWNGTAGARVHTPAESVHLDAGAAALVTPGTAVHCELLPQAPRPLRHLYIHFRLTVGVPVFPCRLMTIPVAPALGRSLERLSRPDVRQDRPFDDVFFTVSLVGALLREVPRSLWLFDSRDPRVKRALEQISQHYAKPIRVADLADDAGLVPESFSRLFAREVGVPPYRYLKGVRLQRAKELLGGSDLAIDQIAEACGFADRFSFSRAFRQLFRQTPAAYRKHELHVQGVRG